jgi:hypothetical protein
MGQANRQTTAQSSNGQGPTKTLGNPLAAMLGARSQKTRAKRIRHQKPRRINQERTKQQRQLPTCSIKKMLSLSDLLILIDNTNILK